MSTSGVSGNLVGFHSQRPQGTQARESAANTANIGQVQQALSALQSTAPAVQSSGASDTPAHCRGSGGAPKPTVPPAQPANPSGTGAPEQVSGQGGGAQIKTAPSALPGTVQSGNVSAAQKAPASPQSNFGGSGQSSQSQFETYLNWALQAGQPVNNSAATYAASAGTAQFYQSQFAADLNWLLQAGQTVGGVGQTWEMYFHYHHPSQSQFATDLDSLLQAVQSGAAPAATQTAAAVQKDLQSEGSGTCTQGVQTVGSAGQIWEMNLHRHNPSQSQFATDLDSLLQAVQSGDAPAATQTATAVQKDLQNGESGAYTQGVQTAGSAGQSSQSQFATYLNWLLQTVQTVGSADQTWEMYLRRHHHHYGASYCTGSTSSSNPTVQTGSGQNSATANLHLQIVSLSLSGRV